MGGVQDEAAIAQSFSLLQRAFPSLPGLIQPMQGGSPTKVRRTCPAPAPTAWAAPLRDWLSARPRQAEGADAAAWAANRKVAIEKFRAKRKLRKYDKCVRYESRRRLAEARPRVRGMFVKAEVAAAHAAEQAARPGSAKRSGAGRWVAA